MFHCYRSERSGTVDLAPREVDCSPRNSPNNVREKRDRHHLPERPGGGCAHTVPVPFFPLYQIQRYLSIVTLILRSKSRRRNNFRTSVVGQVANLPVQPKNRIQRQAGNLPYGTRRRFRAHCTARGCRSACRRRAGQAKCDTFCRPVGRYRVLALARNVPRLRLQQRHDAGPERAGSRHPVGRSKRRQRSTLPGRSSAVASVLPGPMPSSSRPWSPATPTATAGWTSTT